MASAPPFPDYRKTVSDMRSEFEKFLKPTDIVFDIQGLDDALVEELCEMESLNKRQQAVRKLIDYVLARDDMLSKFVMALEDRGYQRFIDLINRAYPDKGTEFVQEYFAFIINCVKGQLLDILEPLQICAFLYENGCIEQNDKERIEAKHNSQGRYYACQEMLFAVKRRKHNWALLFVDAIKETQEHVKIKLDLSATKEDLERLRFGKGPMQTVHLQLIKKFNVKKCEDTHITGCVILSKNSFLVANYFTDKLYFIKYNRVDDYDHVSTVRVTSFPYDITVIDCDRIAVTYGYKQFIETLDSHYFRVLQTFRPHEDCFGITHQNEKLYVVGKDKIFVMDLSGWKQIVLVIEHATYIAVFEDKLFYTNRNTNLVHCSNMNGQALWQFRNRVIIHPTGIAIDLNQNVFVVGHWSNNLSVISNSGKDCNTLLSEGKGLSQPHAICYDKHRNTLLLCDKLSGNCALYDVS